ncbi:predicted protein [Pyrenophora tritici-repentis Pt-1C-BFP]|uniref:Uncharacterized protein n=2 Tax=Pyrenophora tritici-repentis TaxID=45151 RepID=B2WP11_PYRTR|nr:uncharacterized protein PTRG_11721 [Pyrenophora tritici-repentis Pt-1C-BFP]EDU44771.1 predicted protein [Pyrenophora tritici-repentis Pt-1C-BFP]
MAPFPIGDKNRGEVLDPADRPPQLNMAYLGSISSELKIPDILHSKTNIMASDPISSAISNGAMAPPDMVPCLPARISCFFGIHKVANVTAALLIENNKASESMTCTSASTERRLLVAALEWLCRS